MSSKPTIFVDEYQPPEVIGERGDVLVYRAPDGVPYFGVQFDGRRGGDLVGATLTEPEKKEK
jgi:hypothetical protein